MQFVLFVLVLAAAAAVIGLPLLRGKGRPARVPTELAALETAKEETYAAIRDAELDFRMGKLSESDFRALDDTLRAEAIALLTRLDEARAKRTDEAARR